MLLACRSRLSRLPRNPRTDTRIDYGDEVGVPVWIITIFQPTNGNLDSNGCQLGRLCICFLERCVNSNNVVLVYGHRFQQHFFNLSAVYMYTWCSKKLWRLAVGSAYHSPREHFVLLGWNSPVIDRMDIDHSLSSLSSKPSPLPTHATSKKTALVSTLLERPDYRRTVSHHNVIITAYY